MSSPALVEYQSTPLPNPATFDYAELEGGKFPASQVEGIAFVLEEPRSLLADPMGHGKTVMALGAVGVLRDRGKARRVLVVVDSGSLARQWHGEVDRFLPGLSVMDSTERRFTNPRKGEAVPVADVTVLTYQMIEARTEWVAAQEWDVAILDEASALKGGRVRTTTIRELARDIPRVIALTGSPLENHPMETYEILSVLNLPDLWDRQWFEDNMVVWSEYGDSRKPISIEPSQIQAFRRYLSRFVLRRTEAGLSLPVAQERIVRVPLTSFQSWAFEKGDAIADSLLRFKHRERACAYAGYKDQEESAKVNEMMRLLETEFAGEKVIVWAEVHKHLDIAERALTQAGINYRRVDGTNGKSERVEAISEFRDDSTIQVLLASRVLERGLNLQFCGVLISLGSSWNPEREAQRFGRIRRSGSPFAEVVHITILSDTEFESDQLAKLEAKRTLRIAAVD